MSEGLLLVVVPVLNLYRTCTGTGNWTDTYTGSGTTTPVPVSALVLLRPCKRVSGTGGTGNRCWVTLTEQISREVRGRRLG